MKITIVSFREAEVIKGFRHRKPEEVRVVPAPAFVAPEGEEELRSTQKPGPVPQQQTERRSHIAKLMFVGAIICLIAGAIVFIKSVSGRIGEKRVRVRPRMAASTSP